MIVKIINNPTFSLFLVLVDLLEKVNLAQLLYRIIEQTGIEEKERRNNR